MLVQARTKNQHLMWATTRGWMTWGWEWSSNSYSFRFFASSGLICLRDCNCFRTCFIKPAFWSQSCHLLHYLLVFKWYWNPSKQWQDARFSPGSLITTQKHLPYQGHYSMASADERASEPSNVYASNPRVINYTHKNVLVVNFTFPPYPLSNHLY